jgi:hypothetical protein
MVFFSKKRKNEKENNEKEGKKKQKTLDGQRKLIKIGLRSRSKSRKDQWTADPAPSFCGSLLDVVTTHSVV